VAATEKIVAARSTRRWLALSVLALALLFPLAGMAQTRGEAPAPATSARGMETAPTETRGQHAKFVVLNREIAVFRAPFLGTPAWERAKLSARRLHELLQRGGPGKVAVEDLPQGAMVTVDRALLFVLTPEDVTESFEETPHDAALRAAAVLRRVVSETREARDLERMLLAAGVAAVATLVYAVLLWILFWAKRALQRKMLAIAARESERLHVRGVALFSAETAAALLRGLVSLALTGLIVVLSYQWAAFVFGRFPFTRPWAEKLDEFFLNLVVGILGGIVDALPGLAVAFVIFWLTRVATRALNRFLVTLQTSNVATGTWLDADTVRPTRRLITIGLWLLAAVMAYPYLPGAHTEAFRGISVLIGLMVSLGASSIVAQGGSGLLLMYSRTFRTGDYVRIGDKEGTVTEIGTFATRLRTGRGEEIALPNALVIASTMTNYSFPTQGAGFVLDTSVTIGYDTPWRQVEAMLLEAAGRTDGILQTPAPRVFQVALLDFYVEYRLVTVGSPTEPMPRAMLLTALHQGVQDVFNEHGVQIMSPHYRGDPSRPKVVPRPQWYAAPAKPPEG